MYEASTPARRALLAATLLLGALVSQPTLAADAADPAPNLNCSRQTSESQTVPEGNGDWPLRQQLNAMLTEAGVPGAAVIAVRDDKVLFEMYYGCRSNLPDEQWPVGKDTSFLLASVSKTITAVTVLHLADRISELRPGDYKDLDPGIRACLGPGENGVGINNFLTCPIDVFLAKDLIDFPPCQQGVEICPRPRIRFVELLDHVSGIVDDYDGPLDCVYNLDADSPMNLEQMVERYLNKEASKEHSNQLLCVHDGETGWSTSKYVAELYGADNFGPFGVFRYSNSGYTLLGYLVERVLETVCPGAPAGSKIKKECDAAALPTPVGPAYPMWSYSQVAVLDKLSMKAEGDFAASWLFSELADSTHCARLDQGYKEGAKECRIARPGGRLPYFNFPGYPNGGFRATGRALSNFLRMLMNDGEFEGHEVLSREAAQSIWNFSSRPWPWQALSSHGFTAAAIGFALQSVDVPEGYNALLMGHTGGEMGTATAMFWQPVPIQDAEGLRNDTTRSLGVIVLTTLDALLDSEVMLSVFQYYRQQSIPVPPELVITGDG